MITNKLANPTPFNVDIPYDRGVSLKVNSDDMIELTYEQLQDFRPGNEGYEEIRIMLESNGLFLLDSDKSYDMQALECLRACLQHKEKQLSDFRESLQNARLSQNKSIDDASIQQLLDRNGYGDKPPHGLQYQINKLKSRIEILEQSGLKQQARAQFDPKRTCFGTQPPREFPSETALKIFLEENPKLKAQHDELTKAMDNEDE